MVQKRQSSTPAQAIDTLNAIPDAVAGLPASPDPTLVRDLVEQAEAALNMLKLEYMVDPQPARRQHLRERLT
jgi:hypothetical protein